MKERKKKKEKEKEREFREKVIAMSQVSEQNMERKETNTDRGL
jgi:hypothetical protein